MVKFVNLPGTDLVSGLEVVFMSTSFVTEGVVDESNLGGGGGIILEGGGIIPLDNGWTSFTGAGINDFASLGFKIPESCGKL